MKNTIAKGRRLENLVKKYHQSAGYIVHLAGKKSLFIRDKRTNELKQILVGNDIFGCFDMICAHPSKFVKLIQVTTVENKVAKLAKIYQYEFNYGMTDVELWLYRGRGNWSAWRLDGHQSLREIFEGRLFVKKLDKGI